MTSGVTAFEVMVAPSAAYARGRDDRRRGIATALRRPLLSALVIGTAIALSTTHSVAPVVVASVTTWWSFAVAIQLAAGLILIAPARGRTVPLAAAVDLFFAGHGPWSLWLLTIAVIGLATYVPAETLIATALLPLLWTARIVYVFCREVLRDDRRLALKRTVGHQGFILAFLVVCGLMAIAALPRWLAASG